MTLPTFKQMRILAALCAGPLDYQQVGLVMNRTGEHRSPAKVGRAGALMGTHLTGKGWVTATAYRRGYFRHYEITDAGRMALAEFVIVGMTAPVSGDYRSKNGRTRPRVAVVEAVVQSVADRLGVPTGLITGTRNLPAAVAGRREAWKTIMALEKCSMNGLAAVWGCDRQSIRRQLMRAG